MSFLTDCNNWFNCEDGKKSKDISWLSFWKWLIADSNGCPAIRVINDENSNNVKGYAKNISTTSLTQVLPNAVGLRNYINQILVTNQSTSVGTIVDIVEETTGDIIATGYAAPEGGFSCSYPTAIPQLTTNKKIYAKCTTTGSNITVSVSGYLKA